MKADSAGSYISELMVLLLGLSVPAPAAHAQAPSCPSGSDWPSKMRLEYAVTASRGPFSINGESVLLFERSGKAYTISVKTDSADIYHARQTSRGIKEANSLRPDE